MLRLNPRRLLVATMGSLLAAMPYAPSASAVESLSPAMKPVAPQGGTTQLRTTERRGSLCPAQDPCWFEGVAEQSEFANCASVGGSGYVNAWTGYRIAGNGNYPATGDRYYGHIVAGVVGQACSGKFIDTEIVLPAGTSLDFGNDPNGRVRCYYTSPNTGQTTEVTDSSICGYYGQGQYGANLGGRAVANYGTFEIIFPLRTNTRLSGLGGNDKMVAKIETEDANSMIAPQQWVTVAPSTLTATGGRENIPELGGAADVMRGTLGPASAARGGSLVRLTFYRKRNGVFRKFDSGNVPVDANGAYAGGVSRPGSGTCKGKAAYPVKAPVVTRSDKFAC